MYLSHDLTLTDVIKLCRQHYIPEGCVLIELRASGDKELWRAATDDGIVKGSNFEEDDMPPEEEIK